MNLGDEGDSPWGDIPANPATAKSSSNGDHTDPDVKSPSSAAPQSSPVTTTAPSKTRGKRGPNRTGAQSTRLEAVDSTSDPLLGPLGGDTSASPGIRPGEDEHDIPPELPQKENRVDLPRPPSQKSNLTSPPPSRGRGRIDDPTSTKPSGGRSGPGSVGETPGSPYGGPGGRGGSMTVEQASKPTFNVIVGDPHKVGDLTGSHTVYQVRTKTTSKAYRQPEFEVSRRYRDFLWLYNQLHSNNPGVVVPPPPEKQAVGRFESDFVESRRQALEKMLNKTCSHPILQHDGDLKVFLESESFNVDMKNRERKDPDMPGESKGLFGSMNLSVGSNQKFIEHDEWFLDRRLYLDALEQQLRALMKAHENTVDQRRALSTAAESLSESLNSLAQVELSPILTGPLAGLSDLHLRIRDLYSRQAQQDALTLGITIDEYIRLIGSIKKAFDQRQKSWAAWSNADGDLQKRRSALDKLMRSGRSQTDRMAQLQADVGDAERRANGARLVFEDLGRSMRAELERFEREKVEDFRSGVETYLEAAIEAQKELIELWETYLMQLDADGEDELGPGGANASRSGRLDAPHDILPDRTKGGQPTDMDSRPNTDEGSSRPSAETAVGDE